MMNKMTLLLVAFLMTGTLALTGCGGGGGGGGGTGDGGTGDGGTGGGDGQATVAETIFTLVELTGFDDDFTVGVAINNLGLAVGFADAGTQIRGTKWSVTSALPTAVELAPLSGNNFSAAYGVNDFGIAVGESGTMIDDVPDARSAAVYWPEGTVSPISLSATGLYPGGSSTALAINNDGEIVGEAVDDEAGQTVAVYWASPGAAPVKLAKPSANGFGSAFFISSMGDIVGEAKTDDGQVRAVAWRPSPGSGFQAPLLLDAVPFQIRSAAFGIDFSGRMVGEAELEDGTVQGVIWNSDGTVAANLGSGTSAQSINGFDRVAGYTAAFSGSDRPIIWNAEELADFQSLGSVFGRAYALNDSDETVGVAGNRAFAAIPRSE